MTTIYELAAELSRDDTVGTAEAIVGFLGLRGSGINGDSDLSVVDATLVREAWSASASCEQAWVRSDA